MNCLYQYLDEKKHIIFYPVPTQPGGGDNRVACDYSSSVGSVPYYTSKIYNGYEMINDATASPWQIALAIPSKLVLP